MNVKKARDPKNRPPIGVTPEGDVYDELETICAEMERPRAWVVYKLMLRGLAAYRRDKQINESEPKPKSIKVPDYALGQKRASRTGTNDK